MTCFFNYCFPEKAWTIDFWLSVCKSYPMNGVKAIKIMLPFASSWFFKYGFSALTEIKSMKGEGLVEIDNETRMSLTMMESRLDLICSQKLAHSSQ